MTNAEKFEEVFKRKPDKECCVFQCPPKNEKCDYLEEKHCECNRWWDEEFKE